MARPTLSDVAQAAGVSPATVDRVMNERAGVSARTRTLVLTAAQRLGYLPDTPDTPFVPMSVHFVLPHGTNAYIAELSRQAQQQVLALPHMTLDVRRSHALDPLALAEMLTLCAETADAVAVVPLDHPAVREAIRSLTAARIPVVTLASDIPHVPRRAYIGIDNGQAGRLAGYALGRFLGLSPKGKVALFAGSLGYRGHHEREMGFRQVLAEDYPHLQLLELRESREDRKKAHRETRVLLDAHPDLVGIYNAGGATVGIGAALEDAGRAKTIVFVGHEVTDENMAYLLSGTLDAAIDQNARAQIAETLKTLSHAVQGKDYTPDPPHLRLVLRENLPVV